MDEASVATAEGEVDAATGLLRCAVKLAEREVEPALDGVELPLPPFGPALIALKASKPAPITLLEGVRGYVMVVQTTAYTYAWPTSKQDLQQQTLSGGQSLFRLGECLLTIARRAQGIVNRARAIRVYAHK